jgi:hypothetical protein
MESSSTSSNGFQVALWVKQEAGDLVALFPADDDKKLQTSWL